MVCPTNCRSLPVLTFTFWASWLLPLGLAAADWPQFRGPDRTDVSNEANLLQAWPANGPPVAWKADGLGTGFSSISVAGDRIYSMGDKGDSSFILAFDRATGRLLWETPVGKPGGNYAGTRCTPTVDGDRVFGLGQFGDLVGCESATGKLLWKKNLTTEFGGRYGSWQYAESPLVDGDRLVCTPGGEQAAMVALNKHSGEVVWKGVAPGGVRAGYSSVVISEAGGVRQYVQLMAGGLVSFAAEDGKLLWQYGTERDRFGGNTANIPTPIVNGDYLFAAAGYGRGGGLIKLMNRGEAIAVEEVYFNRNLTNRHGGVVLVGDYIYGDRDQGGLPWCAEWRTGEIRWKKEKRSDGQGSVAITYADGRLYMQYQNGIVALVEATPEKYQEISTFRIPEAKEPCWSHPVVAGGRLYVRNQDVLWCYDIARH